MAMSSLHEFMWTVSAIDQLLHQIEDLWADKLGVSGLQWKILMALADLDEGDGVQLRDIATLVRADKASVIGQLKLLAIRGFVRTTGPELAARARLSLVGTTRTRLAEIQTTSINARAEMLRDLDDKVFGDLTDQLETIELRLREVIKRFAIDH